MSVEGEEGPVVGGIVVKAERRRGGEHLSTEPVLAPEGLVIEHVALPCKGQTSVGQHCSEASALKAIQGGRTLITQPMGMRWVSWSRMAGSGGLCWMLPATAGWGGGETGWPRRVSESMCDAPGHEARQRLLGRQLSHTGHDTRPGLNAQQHLLPTKRSSW